MTEKGQLSNNLSYLPLDLFHGIYFLTICRNANSFQALFIHKHKLSYASSTAAALSCDTPTRSSNHNYD